MKNKRCNLLESRTCDWLTHIKNESKRGLYFLTGNFSFRKAASIESQSCRRGQNRCEPREACE